MRKCDHCKTKFAPSRMSQKACSPACAIALAPAMRIKADKVAAVKARKADAVKREKLKSRADWAREAQSAVNAFIRMRDDALPCISCGRHHQGQYHAGHYLSRGARPELRFEELNIHKQCAPCNTHLSGNAVLFRKALIEKIGLELVEWLEGARDPRKDTIDDLKAIKAMYQQKTRELKAISA